MQLSMISDDPEDTVFEAPPPDYQNVANSANTSRNSRLFVTPPPAKQAEIQWNFQGTKDRSRVFALHDGQIIDYVFQLGAIRTDQDTAARVQPPPESLLVKQRVHHTTITPIETEYENGVPYSKLLGAYYDQNKYAFITPTSPQVYMYGYKIKGQ